MDSYKFQKACKEWLIKYYKDHYNKVIGIEDVFVVWSCKTLQNNKILISTTINDGVYVEVTYNGDNKEAYFDIYTKVRNIRVSEQNLIDEK
ncbi:DUF6275 family protein [Anaerococcus sp. NML200537]|uniref:DUF6275 family protein n=1 Tax=Anaerococcus sp. NML200537 TaxID=2954485 RepID=UPI002237288D|nr:DUF6275 family protein [Anaerococcus sp. NML200537]MCW6702145.1 DUF6275 family protein [Anaerococcus sp. NML200537]